MFVFKKRDFENIYMTTIQKRAKLSSNYNYVVTSIKNLGGAFFKTIY